MKCQQGHRDRSLSGDICSHYLTEKLASVRRGLFIHALDCYRYRTARERWAFVEYGADTHYLITYLLTYLLHGAESFLRS